MFLKIFENTQALLLYWFAAQQQTFISRRQKFGLFHLTVLKATGSGQKIAKTKIVQKTAYMWLSGPKG